MEDADKNAVERTRRILRERARLLSLPIEEARPLAEEEWVVFSLGAGRYGIELPSVREVLPLPELVPVPHTPAWVAGVMSYRGRVLSVVDLAEFLALPGIPAASRGNAGAAGRRLLVLELPEMLFGVLVDHLEGVVSSETALAPSPLSADAEGRSGFILGIAPGGIAVLDVPALAHHPRFQVSG